MGATAPEEWRGKFPEEEESSLADSVSVPSDFNGSEVLLVYQKESDIDGKIGELKQALAEIEPKKEEEESISGEWRAAITLI